MVGNRIRKDTNEPMVGVKIIQNAKVKIQNYKLKVKSFFALLFSFIRQLALHQHGTGLVDKIKK